jgi:hypothetical protein
MNGYLTRRRLLTSLALPSALAACVAQVVEPLQGLPGRHPVESTRSPGRGLLTGR